MKEIIYHLNQVKYYQSQTEYLNFFQDLLDITKKEDYNFVVVCNNQNIQKLTQIIEKIERLIEIDGDNNLGAAGWYANELQKTLSGKK